jgi:hypothetical protein
VEDTAALTVTRDEATGYKWLSEINHDLRCPWPNPDGYGFVVLVDGDNETAIDETFATKAAALAEADRLN